MADERRKLLDNVVEEGELQTSQPPSPELEKPEAPMYEKLREKSM